jgi:type IV pilus assembly protein PilA
MVKMGARHMKRFLQKGFSSMSMVAAAAGVVIIGSAVYFLGFPAQQDDQVQNKLAEVFVSVSSCRAEINQMLEKKSAQTPSKVPFTCDGGASAGVKISPHLKSIAVSPAGAITAMLDFRSLPELTPATNMLSLVPLADATHVLAAGDAHQAIHAWRCGSPQDGTTIPAKYLPANCRG